MKTIITTCAALIIAGISICSAVPTPLVQFDFEGDLKNHGSLGGAGYFRTFATNEPAGFGVGPFGRCLDLTAASRHGGSKPNDPPAGSAVGFRDAKLDVLENFTILLWYRQNPNADGVSARLLTKEGSWDLMPHAAGAVLALGPGNNKATYSLAGKTKTPSESQWRFLAVAVGAETVRAYVGGLQQPLALVAEEARKDQATATRGDLLIGTFGGIRPFNGWFDRVRIFEYSLTESDLKSIYEADQASAVEPQLPGVLDLGRPAANTHRFQLQHSAIPFSTRWQKNTNAPAIMKSFHATDCLWVYGGDTNFIRQIQNLGLSYQGTLNGLQGQIQATTNRSATGDPSGRHEDLDGNKNTPSWMVTFGPRTFTGCCNHPAFRRLFFNDAKRLVQSGVDSLHVDDWAMNASWVRHGGVCFCEACRTGFREWLLSKCTAEELKKLGITDIKTFNYRDHLKRNGVPDVATYRAQYRTLPLTPQFEDFQVESMRNFFREFRRQLDAWSPKKYIPVSVNGLLYTLRADHTLYGVDAVDFLHGESSQNENYQTLTEYLLAAKSAEAVGLSQVISPIPRSTARTRAALATTYALGQPHLVPWDIYMGSDATGVQPRYFGTRDQYGDLYDFIHDHRDIFDGFESAAEVGVLVNADAPLGSPGKFCRQLAERQIPFHLILGASKYAQLPIRASDLKAIRVLIEFSSTSAFTQEDQNTLAAARATGQIRFVPATTDLATLTRNWNLDLLRIEGPENIVALPRVHRAKGSAAIHLVNWNFERGSERAESYRAVTLTLLQPRRWGKVSKVLWHEPGKPAVALVPERHADSLRLVLPQLGTWGIVEIN